MRPSEIIQALERNIESYKSLIDELEYYKTQLERIDSLQKAASARAVELTREYVVLKEKEIKTRADIQIK